MQTAEHCGVCGTPLEYGTEETTRNCSFCGDEFPSLIYCPEGHYVCDSCHSAGALDILREVLLNTHSTCPGELLETVMSHPAVPMHGPEHHAMVPAILVRAVENSGYPVPQNAVEKAIERGSKVPGGWCGSHGACGAGIGAGIAISVITEATPLTGEPRGLANEATAYVLGRLVDNGARCCKRASRNALELAVEFFRDRIGIELTCGEKVGCRYISRNRECTLTDCPYFKPKQKQVKKKSDFATQGRILASAPAEASALAEGDKPEVTILEGGG